MNNIVYGNGDITIAFTSEVINFLLHHRQKNIFASEAGGQLFARFDEGTTTIVAATGPTRLDKRFRYGFIPSRFLQRQEIQTMHASGKHFVGDWHTHPQPRPVPSSEDVASMIDCFRKSRHELMAFVMVIVGTAELPDGLYVALVGKEGVTRLDVLSHTNMVQVST